MLHVPLSKENKVRLVRRLRRKTQSYLKATYKCD